MLTSMNTTYKTLFDASTAAKVASDQAQANCSSVYDSIKEALWAAEGEWRSRNPEAHISRSEKDPKVAAIRKPYDDAVAIQEINWKAQTAANNALATAVAADVNKGEYPKPMIIRKPSKKGFRYYQKGEQVRESSRNYGATMVVLVAHVNEDGSLGKIEWNHYEEFSATAKRLQSKVLNSAPYYHDHDKDSYVTCRYAVIEINDG